MFRNCTDGIWTELLIIGLCVTNHMQNPAKLHEYALKFIYVPLFCALEKKTQ